MSYRKLALLALFAGALALLAAQAGAAKPKPKHHHKKKPAKHKVVLTPVKRLASLKHIVVIYEENHSFDNLYGGWENTDNLSKAALGTKQVNQAGVPFTCLLQNDVNLTSPPLAPTCTDTTTGTPFSSHFTNAPFKIDDYIPPTATTCPPTPGAFSANGFLNGTGSPGGCTRDIVHRFYQEQYQLDGGKQDRYTTGSDAVGLTQGTYNTQSLPIYQYLHSSGHPRYVIADKFFQGAFGGSFLNHQWLIAAQSPVWTNADQSGGSNDLHSIVDSNGMPNTYPLYKPTSAVKDSNLTVKCPAPVAGLACGDYAVNTTQPWYQPSSPGTADARRLPPLTSSNIGDELSARGVTWAWYAGGWSNANGDVGAPGWTNGNGPSCSDPNALKSATYPNCPDGDFQFHHQPFNYFATYAPGTQARKDHLLDEQSFIQSATASSKQCQLKQVSFIKPIGEENEHPGYASESRGSDHLVQLLKQIEGSACSKDTMVVVTYDEFGGQWDHVPPPGQGSTTPGPHDQWGPGTRVPALILTPGLAKSFAVDHTSHDTTSIVATIEHRYGLKPLSSRDAAVADLKSAWTAK